MDVLIFHSDKLNLIYDHPGLFLKLLLQIFQFRHRMRFLLQMTACVKITKRSLGC